MNFRDLEACFTKAEVHVVSIRKVKTGWAVNVRETETRWRKPLDKPYPTIEAAMKAYFGFEEPEIDLSDILG